MANKTHLMTKHLEMQPVMLSRSEASVCPTRQMLPLRFTQGFGSQRLILRCTQDDKQDPAARLLTANLISKRLPHDAIR